MRVLSPPPLPVGLPQRRTCRAWDSNPQPAGFKPAASADWATTAMAHGWLLVSLSPCLLVPTCCEWDSNPHVADSRSAASANWATAALARSLARYAYRCRKQDSNLQRPESESGASASWATAAACAHARVGGACAEQGCPGELNPRHNIHGVVCCHYTTSTVSLGRLHSRASIVHLRYAGPALAQKKPEAGRASGFRLRRNDPVHPVRTFSSPPSRWRKPRRRWVVSRVMGETILERLLICIGDPEEVKYFL